MEYSNIILAAGKIDTSLTPSGTNISQGMIPVNGKPVISWIIDDLIYKHIQQITIVVRKKDKKIINFLEKTYSPRIKIKIAAVDENGSIIDSLAFGIKQSNQESKIRLILGDTLIKDSFEHHTDMVYVGPVDERKRWCLVKLDSNQNIIDYHDKDNTLYDSNLALSGYYEFTDGNYLLQCALDSSNENRKELSDVLKKYSLKHPLKGFIANEWYDFGHIDTLVRARRKLLQPRHFNKLTINPLLNTITKQSTNNSKLEDELNWYLTIPEELKILAPRLINYSTNKKEITIVQEYYGYPTLAELYVYGEMQTDTWISILQHVLKIQREFSKYTGVLDISNLYSMYIDKTETRLKELSNQSLFWKSLLSKKEIKINGHILQNIPNLKNKITDNVRANVPKSTISVIHGDFCFSNILFDITHQIIRLIDPRGSFGIRGIYGDSSYDIAKLRHSVNGLYDYITANMFNVTKSNETSFQTEIYYDPNLIEVQNKFDDLITKSNIDLNHIMLIEGLLFVSLTPLHKDDLNRQLMLYLNGIQTLNQVI